MYGYGCFISANGKPVSGGSFDADAQSFFTATGITDLTQKNAVNQLVLDLKSNSLWTKMKAIYPVVGGNATAHSYNLKNTSQYQLSFSSGWTHSSTGMLPDGTSAYANTNLNIGSVMSANSVAFGIYFNTLPVKSSSMNGTWSGGKNTLYRGSSVGNYTYWNGGEILRNTSAGDNYGLQQISRYNTTQILRKHKSGSTETISDNYTSMSSTDFYLGKANGYDFYEDRKICLSYLSDGLVSADLDNLYNCIQTFQTSLSRQV